MIDTILKLIKDNSKFLGQLVFSLFILYWFFYFMTPKIELSESDSEKLKDLDSKIESLVEEQRKVDKNISMYNGELDIIQDSILKLKKQRDIIQNFYDEKNDVIVKFDDLQLDSFFTERYGYSQTNIISNTSGKADSK